MSEINSASFPLYTAHGIRVHFTVPFDGNGAAVSAVIDRLLNDGFRVNAPGLEEGEKYEEIAFIVRRAQIRDDGSEVPILDLYPEKLNFRFVSTYLDNAEQVAAFESATGLKLDALATYEGSAPIERGKNPRHDQKYVTRLPRLTKIVFKDNPRFEEGGTKPKRYFERWHGAAPTTPPTETRHMALLDRNGKPTGAQPQPSANPTPPSPSASTAGTATGNGVSHEPKVVNGSDPAVFGELFPASAVNVVTPDALYARVAGLFNAKQHFMNWWAQHEENLLKHTTNEAEEYTRAWRWNWDKEKCQELVDLGGDMFNMQTKDVLEALATANGKKLSKFRDWDGGTWNHAKAALAAWCAGYDAVAVAELSMDDEVKQLAAVYCQSYQEKQTA